MLFLSKQWGHNCWSVIRIVVELNEGQGFDYCVKGCFLLTMMLYVN